MQNELVELENLDAETAHEALWRQGNLQWKLRDVQKRMHQAIRAANARKFVNNCARRLGKSFLMCLMAVEDALQIEDAQIRFAAPTQKALKKICLPLFRDICKDAPRDIRPRWYTQDGLLYFPSTNSEIHVAGSNKGNCENLRGTLAHRCYIDEAGYIDELRYLIDDILMPQLLSTNGRMVISSTPPPTPAHDFVSYAYDAEAHGSYATYTIHDAGYAQDIVDSFCIEAGGVHSTTWKREYLCQFVVDQNMAIVPEWTDQFICDPPVDEFRKYYHRYDALDIGVADFTACLFGYYDFKRGHLFIEDEYIINGPTMTTDILAANIRAKEKELWPDGRVTTRVGDNNNLLLLQDLTRLHNLPFGATSKDTLEAMVNELRIFVANQRLRVSSKCTQLLGCLKNAIWDEQRRQFARSSIFGHFDALAALVYMVRNLDQQTNPIPPLYNISEATHYIEQDFGKPKPELDMRQMLGLGGTKRG